MLSVLLLGCGTDKSDEGKNLQTGKPAILSDFIIMAYSGPPPGEVTLERYQEIADAGIEYLVPGNGTFDEETNLKAMELGEQTGIKIVPVDIRLFPFELKPDMVIDTAVIREIVNSYKDQPAFASYVVKDEPSGDLFQALSDICDIFRAEDPEHVPLINLLPSYGSPTQLGFDDYRTHIVTYIETVNPELLSYDYYALRNEGITWYDGWFSDLAIVREETRKVDIPYIVFIQSEGIGEGLRVPNRAEILWQVNTGLAYGARGFGWFTYWTPLPDQGFQQAEGAEAPIVESHYNAMIDIDGNRTEIYEYVREANLYLKKAGRGLLDWDNTDVARWEAGKLIEGTSPIVSPEGENANIVIGIFRKDNSIRIVISNTSCEEPSAFSLNVSADWNIDDVFTSIDATPASDGGSLTEWTLEPGGSVVIDLK